MVDSIKGPVNAGASIGGALGKPPGAAGSAEPKDSFGTVLKDAISKVNNLQTEADRAIEGLARGENKNIHETMIAVEKANLSFNMMLQVRNKILQAYEEIMRTQV